MKEIDNNRIKEKCVEILPQAPNSKEFIKMDPDTIKIIETQLETNELKDINITLPNGNIIRGSQKERNVGLYSPDGKILVEPSCINMSIDNGFIKALDFYDHSVREALLTENGDVLLNFESMEDRKINSIYHNIIETKRFGGKTLWIINEGKANNYGDFYDIERDGDIFITQKSSGYKMLHIFKENNLKCCINNDEYNYQEYIYDSANQLIYAYYPFCYSCVIGLYLKTKDNDVKLIDITNKTIKIMGNYISIHDPDGKTKLYYKDEDKISLIYSSKEKIDSLQTENDTIIIKHNNLKKILIVDDQHNVTHEVPGFDIRDIKTNQNGETIYIGYNEKNKRLEINPKNDEYKICVENNKKSIAPKSSNTKVADTELMTSNPEINEEAPKLSTTEKAKVVDTELMVPNSGTKKEVSELIATENTKKTTTEEIITVDNEDVKTSGDTTQPIKLGVLGRIIAGFKTTFENIVQRNK